MRQKRWKSFNKVVFKLNKLVALLLLISYFLPYIPPKCFSSLAVLSLSIGPLIFINVLFLLYWLIQFKKQILLSLIVLMAGLNYINLMYRFSSPKEIVQKDEISILTFNVFALEMYYGQPYVYIKNDMKELFYSENADIICLQEYPIANPIDLEGYNPFNTRFPTDIKGGQAIYSKFPIINSGSLEFPDTDNNAIFVDVVKQRDTIRIYNIHLQSAKVERGLDRFKIGSVSRIFSQIGNSFEIQQDQMELILAHKSKCKYKTIITGDLNNTAFSYVYRKLKSDDFVDTFEKAGQGFGKSFIFRYFPLRLDFILADKSFTVNSYKTLTDKMLSDHYPVKATMSLK